MIDGRTVSTMDVRFGSQYTPTREGVFSVYWKSRHHVSTIYDTPCRTRCSSAAARRCTTRSDFAARGYSGASHGCVNVRDKGKIAALFAQVRDRRQGRRLLVRPRGRRGRVGRGRDRGNVSRPRQVHEPWVRGNPGSVRRPMTSRLTHYCVTGAENVTPGPKKVERSTKPQVSGVRWASGRGVTGLSRPCGAVGRSAPNTPCARATVTRGRWSES